MKKASKKYVIPHMAVPPTTVEQVAKYGERHQKVKIGRKRLILELGSDSNIDPRTLRRLDQCRLTCVIEARKSHKHKAQLITTKAHNYRFGLCEPERIIDAANVRVPVQTLTSLTTSQIYASKDLPPECTMYGEFIENDSGGRDKGFQIVVDVPNFGKAVLCRCYSASTSLPCRVGGKKYDNLVSAFLEGPKKLGPSQQILAFDEPQALLVYDKETLLTPLGTGQTISKKDEKVIELVDLTAEIADNSVVSSNVIKVYSKVSTEDTQLGAPIARQIDHQQGWLDLFYRLDITEIKLPEPTEWCPTGVFSKDDIKTLEDADHADHLIACLISQMQILVEDENSRFVPTLLLDRRHIRQDNTFLSVDVDDVHLIEGMIVTKWEKTAKYETILAHFGWLKVGLN